MRIAIDIDSTLHHYWDLLSGAAERRFGVDLPYEELCPGSAALGNARWITVHIAAAVSLQTGGGRAPSRASEERCSRQEASRSSPTLMRTRSGEQPSAVGRRSPR